MDYNEIPALLKELWGLNLKTTVEESYGKAMLLIEKDENLNESAIKAINIIAKQKNLKIINFDKQTALF